MHKPLPYAEAGCWGFRSWADSQVDVLSQVFGFLLPLLFRALCLRHINNNRHIALLGFQWQRFNAMGGECRSRGKERVDDQNRYAGGFLCCAGDLLTAS